MAKLAAQAGAEADGLAARIEQARALRDELQFLVERGERAADRAENAIAATRGADEVAENGRDRDEASGGDDMLLARLEGLR